MIRNFTAERQRLIDEITGVQEKLKATGLSVREAKTVDEKLALFTDRDRLLEQQHSLQVKIIYLDQEEIEHITQGVNAPKFRPASR
jgi:hypothetical protein